MVTREADQMYLECPVVIPPVHLETFDGHEQP